MALLLHFATQGELSIDARTIAATLMSDVSPKSYKDTLYRNEELKSFTRYRFDYVGAARAFFDFLPKDKTVSAETALTWKAEIGGKFSASTVNVMIAPQTASLPACRGIFASSN